MCIFDEKRQLRYLKKLAKCGRVAQAAAHAGVTRATVWNHKKDNPEFAAASDSALIEYAETVLEPEADRRAVEGCRKLKFNKHGEAVLDPDTGEPYIEREYSDTLLIFRLKALKPDVYRENSSVEHSGSVGVFFAGENELEDEGGRG